MMFEDIDGFSKTDIYAVGGKGDAWHFDGERWQQLPFPSNMQLEAVCCAGDGQVYIGAEQGTVFRGRGNRWEMIYKGQMSLPYRDMVWHDGRVWCTSDYGLWTITDGQHERADVPHKVYSCAGHLSVGDGVMLLAGLWGTMLHDGKEWLPIIDFSQLSR
ncbi:hypothetical protein ABHF33_02765 [Chitinibacter sp. FCG-7]|uniref:Uncharacterized protein n=1 Tax=Chitinibacter mangrovi TaxID=3153927 RepID=A0AAU7FB10_9NEIS